MAQHEPTEPVLAKAWTEFHGAQQEVLDWMTGSARFRDVPQHRAKAYHTLLEAIAMCYNFAIAPRRLHPRLQVNTGWQTDVYTLGQNGPDLFYAVTFLDGAQTYRLSGNYRSAVLILCQVIKHLSGHPDAVVVGDHDLATFDVAADGSFEFVISATPHPGNWIPLDPDSGYQFLLFRRFMTDWNDARPELTIERTSPLPDDHYDADEFDEVVMARRIEMATRFLRYLVRDFNLGLYDFYRNNAGPGPELVDPSQTGFNRLAFLPGTTTSQVGSSFSNYAMAVFDLAEDEALILEFDQLPDGVYWSLQLGDVWSRSLNYMYRQTSINHHQAVIDEDGGFRAVIAHRDPGLANWLDTTGRVQGTAVFRNYRASRAPVPASRKVKLADLRANLPADTATITPEERRAALRRRFEGVRSLHGE